MIEPLDDTFLPFRVPCFLSAGTHGRGVSESREVGGPIDITGVNGWCNDPAPSWSSLNGIEFGFPCRILHRAESGIPPQSSDLRVGSDFPNTMNTMQSAIDCLSRHSLTSSSTHSRMLVNYLCPPSYVSSKFSASQIRSLIRSQIFLRPSASMMVLEEQSSTSYAVASLIKFNPAVAMSLMNSLAIPPVPRNTCCILWRRVNAI